MNGTQAFDFSEKTVKLGANIDLSGKKWTPIGTGARKAFEGVFDGQNYTISNIEIASEEKYVGFFGYISGGVGESERSSIKNLTLSNVNINVSADKTRRVGAFVGSYSAPYGEISNCSVTGSITCTAKDEITSRSLLSGGFVGEINPVLNPETPPAVVVKKCSTDVDISGKSVESGGFVGLLGSSGEITECAALGNVEIENVSGSAVYVGGFIAAFDSENGPVAVKKSYAMGKVDVNASGSYMYVGGFAGANYGGSSDNIFAECMTASDVTSKGGSNAGMNLTGGFIGASMSNGKISDCYCKGDVSAKGGSYSFGGGFAGYYVGEIKRCYCAGNVENDNTGSVNRAYAFCTNVNKDTNMDNCFALGESMKADNVSGFISTSAEGNFTNLGYFGEMEFNGVTPAMQGHSAVALTVAQVGNTETYTSFDESVWIKTEGKLPVLKAIPETVQTATKPAYICKKVTELSMEMPEELVYNGNAFSSVFNVAEIHATFDGNTVYPKGYTIELYDGDGNSIRPENVVDAGNYTAKIAIEGTDEQYWGKKTIPFTIKKAKVKITVNDIKATVGDPIPDISENGYTVTGLAEGDSLQTAPVLSYESQPDMQKAGEVTIKASGAELNENVNYESEIEYIDGKLTVNAKAVSGGSSATRYTVTFDTDGGSAIANQRVRKNSKATEPANPTKEGYVFDGWYTDSKLTTGYDFDTKVTKNMTLYAKWVEDEVQEPSDDKKDDNKGDDEQNPSESEWKNPFTDVTSADWFFDNVKYANENGLMSGVTNTAFAPNESLTRAMLVTVLWRAEGEPVVNYAMPFTDVDANAYYAEAVRWAASENIVKGMTETEFVPDENITREQIAAIFYRYAEYKGVAPTGAWAIKLDYADVTGISDYAVEGVMYCTMKNIMQGKDNNMFAPKDHATRAEIAAILHRFIEGNN